MAARTIGITTTYEFSPILVAGIEGTYGLLYEQVEGTKGKVQ